MKNSIVLSLVTLIRSLTGLAVAGETLPPSDAQAQRIDLLKRYPTELKVGDTAPERARPWEFTAADVFRVSKFHFEAGKNLRVDIGPAQLGIGHCLDGAVWAVLVPKESGELASSATNRPEVIAHVWLRFHPKEITHLFPPETVFAGGASNLVWQIRAIANSKINSSWQAGGNATIPEPKDLTVDVDTKNGPRRFFVVDKEAETARYVAAFENRFVRPPPPLTDSLAGSTFDQLWDAFDRKYAMFVLRPEVDWAKLREHYRPLALKSESAYELAGVCADMLKPLRDLHVWLTVAGTYVPIYNRTRTGNANPQGCRAILRRVAKESGGDSGVAWAVTTNKIGYLLISGWNDPGTPNKCDEALEKMRDTRGLIVDVRLNGGGDEPMAGKVAGRFLEKEFVYAYSQFRNGPSHTNLTQKYERKVAPRGPWRYNRPVVVLIGQKCMSSNESFIGMMTGDPEVATMGDRTCGSSGNPEIIRLPLDLTVSVPRWIDYLPDGTPLDERGFQPRIQFNPASGAFDGDRDDLLADALERLSQAKLPDNAIEGPEFQRFTMDLPDHSRDMAKESQDTSRPKVVSVSPTNDAAEISIATDLRVRFDRPMDPLSLKLNWEAGGFLDYELPIYDSNKFEFTIPVHLVPDALHQVVVNVPLFAGEKLAGARTQWPRDGFQSEDHHLAGLFVWRFRTQAAAVPPSVPPPQVKSISPASGNRVPLLTHLEIQFNEPMTPPADSALRLDLRTGMSRQAQLIPRIQYVAASQTFRIPLWLAKNENLEFTLTGFRSAKGVPARPIKLQYRVSDEGIGNAEREKNASRTPDPRLLNLLKTMKGKRMELTSIDERVQNVTVMQSPNNGSFVEMRSVGAIFKWQKPDLYFGDATAPMMNCSDFTMGSDGRQWWWHMQFGKHTTFQACPAADLQELNISICDPFDLVKKTPEKAASELELSNPGAIAMTGSDYHPMEGWLIQRTYWSSKSGSLVQWRIDPRNYFVAEVTQFYPGFVTHNRFLYDVINTPLAAADFAAPKPEGLSPTSPEPLDANFTKRFINLRDGSDSEMSMRWGKKGAKAVSSSGLN